MGENARAENTGAETIGVGTGQKAGAIAGEDPGGRAGGVENLDRWHGGHWFHGEHLGRRGWWWVVDDGWYGSPAPVYPYREPWVPPVGVTPSAGDWHHGASANAYYLYVTQCPEGSKQVVPQSQP